MKSTKTFKSIRVVPAAPTVTADPVITSSSLASVFVAEDTQKLIAEQTSLIVPTVQIPYFNLPGYVKLYNDSSGGRGTYKVWECWRANQDVVTRWGAEHAQKQESRKTFYSESEARKHLRMLIESKRKKGYREQK